MIEVMREVLGEADYLIHLPEEYGLSKVDMRRIIKRRTLRSDELYLVASHQGEIIANLDAECDSRYRLCHSIEIGLFVKKDYRTKGLGKIMLRAFLAWASQTERLRRVELHVHENNQAALALYRSFGFEIEGRRYHALREDDGTFADDIIMAKMLPEKTADENQRDLQT